jgi:hypothetical protein
LPQRRFVPIIHRLGGIVIRMYFHDHAPPHVHVIAGELHAKVAIRTGEVIEGEITGRDLRRVRAWLARERAGLLELWREHGGAQDRG